MNTTDINPYAAPATLTPPPIPSLISASKAFREGKFLVVMDGAELPDRCVVTNEIIPQKGWRKKVPISWSSPWALLIVLPACLLGMIPGLLIASALQKKGKITYSLSRKSHWKKLRMELLALGMVFAAIGLIMATVVLDKPPFSFVITLPIAALLLFSCVGMFFFSNPLKPVKFKKGWFRIKGCCPEFLDTLPEISPSPF